MGVEGRDTWAQELLDRLTPMMSALGLLFLLVVVGERIAAPESVTGTALRVVGWALWGAFVAEFAARLVVAGDRRAFLRRNGWQMVFLFLPFLRVLRLVHSVRLLRTGRVLSSTVRFSRSAGRVLTDRIAWLSVVSVILVLGSGELLYEFDRGDRSFGEMLYATAITVLSGEPVGVSTPFGRMLELVLALYSVVVVAAMAATFGAYFLGSQGSGQGGPEDPAQARRPRWPWV
jgi:voltage-gated potassium channel